MKTIGNSLSQLFFLSVCLFTAITSLFLGITIGKSSVSVSLWVLVGIVAFLIIVFVLSKAWMSDLIMLSYVAVFPLYLLDSLHFQISGFLIPLHYGLLPIICGSLIYRQLHHNLRRKGLVSSTFKKQLVLLGLIIGWLWISTWTHESSFVVLLDFSSLFLPYVIVSIAVHNYQQWQLMFKMFLAAAIIPTLWGLYNFYFSSGFWRLATSERHNANQYAFLGEVVFLGLTAFLLHRQTRLRHSFVLLLGVVLLGFALLLTASRGGMISSLSGLLILFALSVKSLSFFKLLVISSVMGVVAVTFVPPNLVQRLLSIQTSDFGSRPDLLGFYLAAILEHPLIGYGSFRSETLQVGAHNGFLSIGYYGGLPAILLITVFFVLHLQALWRIRKFNNQKLYGIGGDVLFAISCTMLVHASVSDYFLGFAFWTILGFQGAILNISQAESCVSLVSSDNRHEPSVSRPGVGVTKYGDHIYA